MGPPFGVPPVEKNGRAVGRVVALWRYPVKSMAEEGLDDVEVGWHGVAGDRRWAFVRDGVPHSGFPWLTLRQRPGMRRYRPRFLDSADPDGSPTRVVTPDGRELDVADPALAAELAPGARVLRQSRGVFDTFPLALLTTASVEGLARLMDERALDPLRFRPNLLVESAGGTPFPEDAWVGAVLRIGGARMRVDKRDGRCAVVNLDPGTGRSDPATLRTIAREREGCLGVYGTTVQPGRIAVGDGVYLDA